MKLKINYVKLISAIILCQLAGIIGSLFTANSVKTWYTTINKPIFNPPSWIFSPVWITLFILMGVSLYIIWNQGFKKNKTEITIFGIQLILNTFWSIIFFGLKNISLAFVEIIILWIMILFTLIFFYKKSKTAAYLLIPYLLWVGFATILNLSILILN
ncbi:tryptophan-rich sensory protein [Candidatus Woesearchaeota archaeon]|jgi:translocator protein|nr:tryptophan-rich sensory protein [Candidatus Woesearchaeota archaeon]